MIKAVTFTAVATLAAIATFVALTIALTVMEDGSGRLGSVESWHISYCLPDHPCDDS